MRLAGDRPISLVCSHGDLLPGHVLSTGHGAVIVDWETLGRRSALYDLYTYFFDRLLLGYAAPGMAVAMQEAITQVQAHVALHPSAENGSLLSLVDAANRFQQTGLEPQAAAPRRGPSDLVGVFPWGFLPWTCFEYTSRSRHC